MDFHLLVTNFFSFLSDQIGYSRSMIIKNSIIGFAWLITGIFIGTLYSSYFGSIMHIENKHDLKEEGISMIILEKKRRTRIVVPKGTNSLKEIFFNMFLFFLYKIKVFRAGEITERNVERAKIYLYIVAFFTLIVIIISCYLMFYINHH